MTEDEARDWISDTFGSDALGRLEPFVRQVLAENGRQNLIATSTIGEIWSRHVVDSAQLIPLAQSGHWIDIGSGAGFPGLVVAILEDRPVSLVEPRARRAEFLSAVCEHLGVASRTDVACSKIHHFNKNGRVISARAVAPVGKLLDLAFHCVEHDTRWLLPKGKSAMVEVSSARALWRGTFHVEHSLTNADSLIVVADKVARR